VSIVIARLSVVELGEHFHTVGMMTVLLLC
jgi:hypothetical protein